MKIVEPSFKLSTPFNATLTRNDGVEMLRFIEIQARISHRSEDRQTEDSWEKFITAVILQHGDWSVAEHASLTATLRVDRGVTHELVRHRLFSFTQESTRFVRYKGDMQFIAPAGIDPHTLGNPLFMMAYEDAERNYQELLTNGCSPQEARNVLPNALASTIAVTGNLRNFRHLFLMRTSRESHPDFRRIAIPMLAEFKRIIPLLYDDIEPNVRQIENLRKPR